MLAPTPTRTSFRRFYEDVFLPEHRQPLNVACHVLGTVLSAGLVPLALLWGQPWALLAYPFVHAMPGLLAHRWVERNAAVGDLRVTRKDYSPLWFIAGNHRMVWDLLTRGFHWR